VWMLQAAFAAHYSRSVALPGGTPRLAHGESVQPLCSIEHATVAAHVHVVVAPARRQSHHVVAAAPPRTLQARPVLDSQTSVISELQQRHAIIAQLQKKSLQEPSRR